MLELTAGQGSAPSGLFTAFGAVTAVFLAQRFFGGKIAGLKEAVKETEAIVGSFQGNVNSKLSEIEKSFASVEQVLGGIQASVSQTQAAIGRCNKSRMNSSLLLFKISGLQKKVSAMTGALS